ncbi:MULTISPECIES: hypothetical protein [Enterobacter]|nr:MULTISPECIES: hypothetical protein [Enterobacter]HDS5941166.1 hypothetical protein [Klebsiella variicola]EKS6582897.1 hypothetical protein [Enterobacter hormaechei]ELC7334058.1 hypothetical protein [Enterobacter hormaechei]ELC7362775.1 hypothetical protein [Enterobacter hormaechei]MCE1268864.1 hypothetical protein [Enterobacter hormaechei]
MMTQTQENVLILPLHLRPVVLMDICTIGVLKERESAYKGSDERKKTRIKQLAMMAESGLCRFSFLVAIIEKATDFTNIMNAEELSSVFQNDYDQIVNFLGRENILEPRELLSTMIGHLVDPRFNMEERAELSIPSSLELLSFFNSLGISSTPAKHLRFDLASRVAIEGERLGLAKGYPCIAICVASIYGCEEARKILKIKKNGREFNPSNCLGDIMTFYRVAKARHMLQSNIGDITVIFRTEDAALESLHTYMQTSVVRDNEDEGSVMNTRCLSPEKFFPALFKEGKCTDEKELNRLYSLLDFVV